jgi:hypothetical protein
MIEKEYEEVVMDTWPASARLIIKTFSIPLVPTKRSRIRFKIAKIKWAEVERIIGG